MTAEITAVCRRPAALGLGLAGVVCHEVSDPAAAATAILAIARGPSGRGVILVERSLHDALPAALRRQLARDGVPVLVPFPDPAIGEAGPPPDEELVTLLQRAIGYRLRLR